MHFIRLAGCTVGTPSSLLVPNTDNPLPILKTGEGAWLCHTYDHRHFFCDTDFKLREWKSFDQLLDDTWEDHLCITGGEPLMHLTKLEEFFHEAGIRDLTTHIETSGTIEFYPEGEYDKLWISVSPKANALDDMILNADEIKLLVDENFDIHTVPHSILSHPQVFVQPINDESMVRRDNYERCMQILRTRPDWHLSIQLHKFLNVR